MTGLEQKEGVDLSGLAKAGFRILSAVEVTARRLGHDLTITCGCEDHKALDPHTLGNALDVRTHDLPDDETKRRVLRAVMLELAENEGHDAPLATSGGLATIQFFGFIEDPGGAKEHLHVQLRKGASY